MHICLKRENKENWSYLFLLPPCWDGGNFSYHHLIFTSENDVIEPITKNLNNIQILRSGQQQHRRPRDNNSGRRVHHPSNHQGVLNETRQQNRNNPQSNDNTYQFHGFNPHSQPTFDHQNMMPWFLPPNQSNFNHWRNSWTAPPFGQIPFPPPDSHQLQM
jgi:hypothetical protein